MRALVAHVSFRSIRIPALMLAVLAVLVASPNLAGAHHETTVEDVVDQAVAEIDGAWFGAFTVSGLIYLSPDVVLYDEPIGAACGRHSPSEGGAVYCPDDVTVYLDAETLAAIGDEYGAFAVAVAIADAWGYHLQALLGEDLGGRTSDLQATCLAGVWAWFAADAGVAGRGDLRDAIAFYEDFTSDEIANAFLFGYETDDIDECFL